VNTGPKQDSETSLYFRTVSHPALDEYRKIFYNSANQKKVPRDLYGILKPRGLAVWIMDDGSRMTKVCIVYGLERKAWTD
jgi:hypothetical protein